MISDPRLVRALQAGASTLVILVAWQLAAQFFPPYLFPPVPDIAKRTLDIFVSGPLLMEVLVTALRIFAGLFGAFVTFLVFAFRDEEEFEIPAETIAQFDRTHQAEVIP